MRKKWCVYGWLILSVLWCSHSRGNSEYGSKHDINTEEPACQKKKKDLKDSKLNGIEYKSKSTASSDCFDIWVITL